MSPPIFRKVTPMPNPSAPLKDPFPPHADYLPFAVPVARGNVDASSAVWKEIQREGTRFVCPAGNFIDLCGERLFDMYFLEKGSVRILFDTLDGRQRALMTFEPGGIFNLACALTHQNASGIYQCVKESTIWRIPGAVLRSEQAVAASPALAAYALRQIGIVALIHSTFLSDMLMDDFSIRFCRYLISLAAQHGKAEFPLGLTQESCAASLGVHRATLSRAIQYLKNQGVLEKFQQGKVRILDMEKLRRMAGV